MSVRAIWIVSEHAEACGMFYNQPCELTYNMITAAVDSLSANVLLEIGDAYQLGKSLLFLSKFYTYISILITPFILYYIYRLLVVMHFYSFASPAAPRGQTELICVVARHVVFEYYF